ncbi:MIO protein, partial [Polyodon spathula]|nr:MIO protein [Polyodon spathula]
MSGFKPDILWSPHHVDRFVICDSELSLYCIESVGNSEAKAGALRLSEETTATLLAINSDTPYMKCVAWYPKPEPECLLAVGQANGRIVLTSLGQSHNSKCKDLMGKERVPKHARQCNTLAWNPVDCNWLAAGLDKHRADFSVLSSLMKQYTEDLEQKPLVNKLPLVYSGIKNIVKSSSGTVESWRCWNGSDRQANVIRYHKRCLALQLCGWIKRGPEIDVEPFLQSLEVEREWERAAAVALFNLDIRRAIQILNKGASAEKGDLNLSIVAMALSGYTDEKNSLWREMCSSLRLQLNNPHLCVMFAFLTSEPGSYDGVLYESSMAVRDRVAFACMFLSDSQLPRYIEKLASEMKEAGNLEGILLTGLTKDGVDLMESYVDRTGDVQTASFCMLKGSPGEVVKDSRVQCWIENYRNLLDAWRFWHKRAEFDIHRGKLDPSSKPLAQVFVSCNFCGKSISYSCSAMPHQGRSFSQYGVSGSPTKSKVTSCPGCRKPLPRCALCLMNMGTPVSSCPEAGKSDEKVDLSKDKKLAQLNNWFTWCHNCRHGGHTGHMLSWFRDHTECPVSACTCKCMQLDTTGNLVPLDSI